MVPTKYMHEFRKFEDSGKLKSAVLILYLIPGLPKDVFGYLVPLTNMPLKSFIIVSNLGRIPGVFISCYAAHGLTAGRIEESIVILAIASVVVLLGVIFRDKIMLALHSRANKSNNKKD